MSEKLKVNGEKSTYKTRREDNNPCAKEHESSLLCLDQNNYKRDLCSKYFENYRYCQAFWNFVYRERKRKGVKPYLPMPEDRPLVKQEYLPHFKGI